MRLLRTALIPAALLVAAPLPAQDWKGLGRLEGKVTDAAGKPIEGASVKLDLPSRGGGTTVTTDKKGKWAILGLAAGQWNIDVAAEGFAPFQISFNLASEGQRSKPIEVTLQRPAGPPPEVTRAFEAAEAAVKAARYPEARAEYEKLLALRPDLAKEINARIALAYSEEKDYGKALDHLQRVLDADPGNATIRGLAVEASLRAGQTERATELVKGIDPATIKDPAVYYNIAVAFLNAQKPEEAAGYLTHAVTVDPAFIDGYYQRALAYLQAGKLEESKADFRKVLELQPEGPQAETARKALSDLEKSAKK
jgi:tetratricopeptide (TPR) repeat protein